MIHLLLGMHSLVLQTLSFKKPFIYSAVIGKKPIIPPITKGDRAAKLKPRPIQAPITAPVPKNQ